jgi:hypothetical protein
MSMDDIQSSKFARFGRSFSATLANKDPKSAPKEPLSYSYQF